MKAWTVSLMALMVAVAVAAATSPEAVAATDSCVEPFSGKKNSSVFCFANPCVVTESCVAKARCVANTCGGCNALFFRSGEFVTNCDGASVCTNPTNGQKDTLVSCVVSPCSTAKCPANPKALCFDNYCGGCNALFFTVHGERVNCDASS